MEERTESENEPKKNDASQESWEETKRRAQGDFSVLTGNRVTIDRIQVQRLLNAKFWENEILHEHLEDPARHERENQPDRGIEPERQA